VVTGAASGIGLGIANAFAGEGMRLVLADLDAPRLEREAAALVDAGHEVEARVTDVGDPSQVQDLADAAVERFGKVNVICNNAGVVSQGTTWETTLEDWDRVLRVNVLGAVNGIRAAVPVMRAQQSGSIVLTASVAGLTAWSHAAPYCATKAAVIQLAKVAAVEYARDGIRVNCVCPGTFRSGIHDGLPAEALDTIAATLKR